VYRTAVAAPDDTLDDVLPAVDDDPQADEGVVVAGVVPSVDAVGVADGSGVTGSAATAPVVTGPPLTGPPLTGPPATGPPLTGPLLPGLEPGGRCLIASSGAARRSEKQYRHLIASSWIISAQ